MRRHRGVRSPQPSPLPHLPSSCPPPCPSPAKAAGGHTGDEPCASSHFQPPSRQGCNAAGGDFINNRKGTGSTFRSRASPVAQGHTCAHGATPRCLPACRPRPLHPGVLGKRGQQPPAAPGRMLKPPKRVFRQSPWHRAALAGGGRGRVK